MTCFIVKPNPFTNFLFLFLTQKSFMDMWLGARSNFDFFYQLDSIQSVFLLLQLFQSFFFILAFHIIFVIRKFIASTGSNFGSQTFFIQRLLNIFDLSKIIHFHLFFYIRFLFIFRITALFGIQQPVNWRDPKITQNFKGSQNPKDKLEFVVVKIVFDAMGAVEILEITQHLSDSTVHLFEHCFDFDFIAAQFFAHFVIQLFIIDMTIIDLQRIKKRGKLCGQFQRVECVKILVKNTLIYDIICRGQKICRALIHSFSK